MPEPDGWIDVHDRLPDPDRVEIALVMVGDYYAIGLWLPDGWSLYNGTGIEPSHWRPLPPPPPPRPLDPSALSPPGRLPVDAEEESAWRPTPVRAFIGTGNLADKLEPRYPTAGDLADALAGPDEYFRCLEAGQVQHLRVAVEAFKEAARARV